MVAVHGLDGHREGSWIAENGFSWLSDNQGLPKLVPNVRVLSYGYDGRTRGSAPFSCQTLHDHAIGLITDLKQERKGTNVGLHAYIGARYWKNHAYSSFRLKSEQ